MKRSMLLAAFLTAATTLPAVAQAPGVARRIFTFLDHRLTVEVLADAPGTLQIVRGEPGTINVAANVPGGIPAFALGGRDGDALRLTAVGGEKADFVVVVPEDAYVRVRLPNSKGGEVGSTRPAGTFTWPGHAAEAVTGAMAAPPAGPMVAHSAAAAPRSLSVPRLTTVRTVRVRIAPGAFEIGGNSAMSVVGGSNDNVEVHTGNRPEDVILSVPQTTRDFTLKLGGQVALVMRANQITSYCEPVTEQTLQGGVRWFTFSPEAGRLSCR